MIVGLAVCEFFTCSIERNIDKIDSFSALAKEKNVELLCFGEAVIQGFHSLNGDFDRDNGIAITFAEAADRLGKISKRLSIALATGYIERDCGYIYSSYIVTDRNGGCVCNYRRISPGWKEAHWDSRYREGVDYELFRLNGRAFTIALCGDLWSNESVLEGLKSETVLFPVYLDYEYEDWTNGRAIDEYAARAKAVGKDVLLVNSILRDDNRAEGGAIHFNCGRIVSQLELSKEDILICEI